MAIAMQAFNDAHATTYKTEVNVGSREAFGWCQFYSPIPLPTLSRHPP